MILTKKLRYIFTSSFLKVAKTKINMPNIGVAIAFKAKYPKAAFVRWNQIDVFKWQVNFSLEDNDFSALFHSEGIWLETVTLLPFSRTPKQVQESFEVKYGIDGLQQIQHVKTPKGDIYEIQWSDGVIVLKVLYDISGKIVGKLIV